MRGLSLWQPWASLVALGHKGIETRSWFTGYRGPLLIHATAHWTPEHALALGRFNEVLTEHGRPALPERLPLGAVVAVARRVEVVRADADSAFPPLEHEFGDLRPGRFGFRLADVVPMSEPVKVPGRLGLWIPRPSLLNEVDRRLERRAAG